MQKDAILSQTSIFKQLVLYVILGTSLFFFHTVATLLLLTTPSLVTCCALVLPSVNVI